jgi:hypothetical protein
MGTDHVQEDAGVSDKSGSAPPNRHTLYLQREAKQ